MWNERIGGSQSRRVTAMVEAAERALAPRQQRLVFRGLPHALGWFWLYRERMQAPQSPQIRDDRDVEGGEGGDLAELFATVSTIGSALHQLHIESPRQHDIVEFTHRDGMTLREIATAVGLSHQQVSIELGRGEAWLNGWLRSREVIA